MKTTAARVLALVVIVVVVTAVVFFYYFRTTGIAALPQKIGDLSLAQTVEGEKANNILDRMHDKEVSLAVNTIGMYTGGSTGAVVYLSVYHSEAEAARAYRKMAGRIEKGNLLFTGYRTVRIGEVDASFCVGQEQDHYFFAHRDQLYWLATDTINALKIAGDLAATLRF